MPDAARLRALSHMTVREVLPSRCRRLLIAEFSRNAGTYAKKSASTVQVEADGGSNHTVEQGTA